MDAISRNTAGAGAMMVLTFALLFPGVLMAQQELFRDADQATVNRIEQARARLPVDRSAKRSRIAAFDAAQLKQPSMVLNLFSDTKLKIVRETLGSLEDDETIQKWAGKIEGDSTSDVTIYFKDKWISGRISAEVNGHVVLYGFDGDESGTVSIVEVNTSAAASVRD